MPPNLLQTCGQMSLLPKRTNGELAQAYVGAVQWGVECREKHQALIDAVKPPAQTP